MVTPFDREIVARTAYGEASSEGWMGILAVVNVINNRARLHGISLAEVCLQGLQFSCWNAVLNGKNNPDRMRMARAADDDVVLAQCRDAVDKVVGRGDNVVPLTLPIPDPTDGATSYFVVGTPAPEWAASMHCCGIIGKHVFYKDAPHAPKIA